MEDDTVDQEGMDDGMPMEGEEEERGGDGMEDMEDGVPMESDDLKALIPRKRSLSPSPAPSDTATFAPSAPGTPRGKEKERSWTERRPKRLRKDPGREEVLGLGTGGAKGSVLSRARLKREKKREGKKARRAGRGAVGGGMEVDAEAQGPGLEGTWMA
jgi:hypothetical protein